MTELSIVIITFNEEKNIARCLDSVAGLAKEIIIVDSFSQDKTREICLRYNVTFIEHPFEGYIEQKNYAASLASCDYILSLDADEALDNTLRKSILNEMQQFSKDGYYMNRMTNYLGKWIRHGAWYPDRKLRLWKKNKGMWGGQNPHDRVEIENGSFTGHLKGNILHYSYYSLRDHIKQLDHFTTISANELHESGKKAGLKMIFSPVASFTKGFFFKLGFLDGYYGMVIIVLDVFAAFLKYAKLRELNRNK